MLPIDESLASVCEGLTGLTLGALVLVPEGAVVARVGGGGVFDCEPLARAAARLASERLALPRPVGMAPFVEYSFVSHEQVVVMLRGGRDRARFVLALCFTRDANLALLLGSSRRAFRNLERIVDWAAWEV
jgi:hypothetical protein